MGAHTLPMVNLEKSKDFPVTDLQEEKDLVMENVEKCSESVRNLIEHKGYYSLKHQQALYNAVDKGKGRFKKLSPEKKHKILIRMEMKSFGFSPTYEHDKLKFSEFYKEIFGKAYQ